MKKKGFTLIELLAVIVILAIIALILVPVISKVIDGARDGANQRSVEGYIGDINYAIMEKVLLEKDAKKYDGTEVTEFDGLSYNNTIVCNYYTVIDGVVQYANECTKKDGSWTSYYNYRIGEGAKKARALGKTADITGIKIDGVLATESNGTYTVTASNSRQVSIEITSNDPVTFKVSKNGNVSTTNTITIGNGQNTFTIVVTSENGKVTKEYTLVVTGENIPTTIEGESILAILRDEDLGNGNFTFVVNGQNYPVHIYEYNGNQTWDGNTIPEKNGFGLPDDIGTASANATRMVIVKVNGDLTNSTTIRPYYTAYGGPKGFLLYVTGTLTNTGTIDNSHGAKAAGQEVYLWKNIDESYEVVPATGGTGGAAVNNQATVAPGNAGNTGGKRSTGGGGSGGTGGYTVSNGVRYAFLSGAGGTGTSYSGGAGGGGNDHGQPSTGREYQTVTAGSSVGGAGGHGARANSSETEKGGGGAGNPGGQSAVGVNLGNEFKGANGTGGLLIIYANNIVNSNNITANGASGGAGNEVNAGGSSGGGSINIFYSESYSNTKTNGITANGGAALASASTGGVGGRGTVTIGKLVNGSYVAN